MLKVAVYFSVQLTPTSPLTSHTRQVLCYTEYYNLWPFYTYTRRCTSKNVLLLCSFFPSLFFIILTGHVFPTSFTCSVKSAAAACTSHGPTTALHHQGMLLYFYMSQQWTLLIFLLEWTLSEKTRISLLSCFIVKRQTREIMVIVLMTCGLRKRYVVFRID